MTLTLGGTTERLKQATQLWDWLQGFLQDECSLDPGCISSVDRSNLINGIFNTLSDPDSKLEAYRKALEEISRQKTTEELEAEEEEYGEASGGDVDGAYDALIGIARKALAAGG